jgi:gamma-glutamylcyclotransferase
MVYGMIYLLDEADEAVLDRYEGVPLDYEKMILPTQYLGKHNYGREEKGIKILDALVYIDKSRQTPDIPKAEYVVRMNCGIRDAVGEGVPVEYIDHYLRPFIPQSPID